MMTSRQREHIWQRCNAKVNHKQSADEANIQMTAFTVIFFLRHFQSLSDQNMCASCESSWLRAGMLGAKGQ